MSIRIGTQYEDEDERHDALDRLEEGMHVGDEHLDLIILTGVVLVVAAEDGVTDGVVEALVDATGLLELEIH